MSIIVEEDNLLTNIESVKDRFNQVRAMSEKLCEPLLIEDYGLQAMAETSPAKWHLAHTSWFFETFLLKVYLKNYKSLNDNYEVLFNSYYNGIGKQFPRAQRGLLSRPSVDEVYEYRHYVNTYMLELLGSQALCEEVMLKKIILGCHHEQQHQELFFTDLKYSWFQNPLYPVYKNIEENTTHAENKNKESNWLEITEDIYDIGFNENNNVLVDNFCFDNELPRHKYYLQEVSIAEQLVTNREFMQFIEDDGYNRSELWLADAWFERQNKKNKNYPLYWVKQNDKWYEYTLSGLKELNYEQPVCHLSGYEADAYARWKKCRLPTEFEWEVFSSFIKNKVRVNQNTQFLESELFHPSVERESNGDICGKVWQWTSSAYSPYPGFETESGAIGEYNGKFMCNQLVLKGGSCVTSRNHYRDSYRNFFYPRDQWQFSGLRLAK